jgi:hypothetical protein
MRRRPERDPLVALEWRYAVIAVLLVVLFIVLRATGAFTGVNETVNRGVNRLAQLGTIGIFIIALVANVSIVIQIPYTLPLLTAALGGASFKSMLFLGIASGLGAGIGAVVSYKVAEALVGRTPPGHEGRFARWINRNVDRRPRMTKVVIFSVAASPLPDGAVTVPLAVVHYGMRRLIVPLGLGKFVHNIAFATVCWLFGSWATHHVSRSASTGVALGVAVIFMLVVAFNAEKARITARHAEAARADAEAAPPGAADHADSVS